LDAFFTDPIDRRRLFRSAVKDVGRIFIVAVVLDTIYQLWILRSFHIGQLLIVAIVCAVVPYVLVRGPIARLVRRLFQKKAAPTKVSAASVTTNPHGRE